MYKSSNLAAFVANKSMLSSITHTVPPQDQSGSSSIIDNNINQSLAQTIPTDMNVTSGFVEIKVDSPEVLLPSAFQDVDMVKLSQNKLQDNKEYDDGTVTTVSSSETSISESLAHALVSKQKIISMPNFFSLSKRFTDILRCFTTI